MSLDAKAGKSDIKAHQAETLDHPLSVSYCAFFNVITFLCLKSAKFHDVKTSPYKMIEIA